MGLRISPQECWRGDTDRFIWLSLIVCGGPLSPVQAEIWGLKAKRTFRAGQDTLMLASELKGKKLLVEKVR